METITEGEFLRWASTRGLGPDPEFPQSAVLEYQQGSESRFWVVPAEPERRPYFLATLIDLMRDWQTCYAWRHRGSWPDPNVESCNINDAVELLILKGLGMPLATAAVVQFARDERESLITLLFSTSVFGWSVGEDLYVVPDHGRQVLKASHHSVVHVSFPKNGELKRWIAMMSEEGFDLPTELPDATFKQPEWMDGGES